MGQVVSANLKVVDKNEIKAELEKRLKNGKMILKLRDVMIDVAEKFEGKVINKRLANAVNDVLKAAGIDWSASIHNVAQMDHLRFEPSWQVRNADNDYEGVQFFLAYGGSCQNPQAQEMAFNGLVKVSGIKYSNLYYFDGLEKNVNEQWPEALSVLDSVIDKINAGVALIKEANNVLAKLDCDYVVKLKD